MDGDSHSTFFRYLSLDRKVPLSRLDQDGYDIVSYMGDRYAYANGQEAFTDTLARYFPKEKNAIRLYIHRMESIAERSPLYSFRNLENPYWQDSTNMQIGVAEYIRSLRRMINCRTCWPASRFTAWQENAFVLPCPDHRFHNRAHSGPSEAATLRCSCSVHP